jgi:hypothetical protein
MATSKRVPKSKRHPALDATSPVAFANALGKSDKTVRATMRKRGIRGGKAGWTPELAETLYAEHVQRQAENTTSAK